MKLYLNETSPFARWVLVCLLEYAVANVELIWVDPWAVPDVLRSINPFSTVPALLTDEGAALYESSLIVNYLLPPIAPLALQEYQRLGLGKMLLETAFRHVSLQRYVPNNLSAHPFPEHPLIEHTFQTLVRVLPTLTLQDFPKATNMPDLASLQLAAGLDYLAFRRPDLVTNHLSPSLHDRLADYQRRPSFCLTTPAALVKRPRLIG